MSKRLITLRQIRVEKISRSRSWIFQKIKEGSFPKPLDMEGPNLWEEDVIDAWLEKFIATAVARANDGADAVRRSTRAKELVEARRSHSTLEVAGSP